MDAVQQSYLPPEYWQDCTAITRPVAATAADLRRQLIPAAQVWCCAAVASAALQQDRENARKARLAELTQARG
jgi:hypothetical protein